jgi:glycine/D-amino acid oxidase-like deaminating enzyme
MATNGRGAASAHANLWEETAEPAPDVSPLTAAASADVLVIGTGYLGLSAALHLAEAGARVLAVDAHPPGWGASGRNGGQIIPGLKYDPDELEAMFGQEAGERLWRFAGATADVVFDLIARHGIAAEARRTAWVQAIHGRAAMARATRRAEQWRRRGAPVGLLDRAETAAVIGTDRHYLGAFIDRRAGSLQPLSYARGLARAAMRAGATLHRDARVVRLDRADGRWRATTEGGPTVIADQVLLCANAYADGLVPGLDRSIIAANSLQIATEPLPATALRRILPGGEVISDTRRLIRYWRLDGQGRLLMGGRGPYREPGPADDWAHLVRDVAELFPFLGPVRFTHRWGGRVAIHPDYLPRLHQPAPGLTVSIGCQGRGIGWQTAMGQELARIALVPGHAPILPFRPARAIPLHGLKAAAVTATVLACRLLDRFDLG